MMTNGWCSTLTMLRSGFVRAAAALSSTAAAALVAVAVWAPARPALAQAYNENVRRATIFYTGAVRGTLEPCGCTSDPLGDVARMAAVVRRAGRPSDVLLVDAGNLLYAGEAVAARRAEGADLNAAFLAAELAKLPFGGAALGESDLARGAEKVVPRRLAANVSGAPVVEASRIRTVGGIRIGVFGVADPALARRHGWKAEDPATAAAREATQLRQQGAEIVIALAALERAAARRVARATGVDFVVVGQNPGEGMLRADGDASAGGGAFIVAPADELQKIGRIDLVLRRQAAGGAARPVLVDAGGGEGREVERAALGRRIAQLDAELARWSTAGAGDVDATFVADRRKERAELEAQHRALAGAFAPPAQGSYFTNQLIPLRRALPRDPQLAAAMRQLDRKVGAANLKRAEAPPPAPPGRAAFVGDRACVGCHKQEAAFWRTTVHARAWKTIVDGGKTGFEDCVSCHVTGFGEVGGSSLGHVDRLTSVQCETCHGPGSLHVEAEGLEEPAAVHLETPESTCVRCHNEKHSDTFQYAAYLRDILGPGHGAKARQQLGTGPTGRELRSKAMAAAKAAGKDMLKKM
jgi:hypothetical protein